MKKLFLIATLTLLSSCAGFDCILHIEHCITQKDQATPVQLAVCHKGWEIDNAE
jgi:hypothetical protein